MPQFQKDGALHGRGASWNPANRFTEIHYDVDPDAEFGCEEGRPPTRYIEEDSSSILSKNDSPDVGYDYSVNPYRGCEHGCIYCYARPIHEYAGYSAGLDFETKIFVKRRAPELLREALSSKKWVPQTVSMSGSTDPYQPIERKLEITRGCLRVFAEFGNPVGLVTKNRMVLRDCDVLAELAEYNAAAVCVSVTTLDLSLNRKLEPRTSSPQQRLETIARLAQAGIPTGVLVAPVIPGLTDHEMPAILKAAAESGATFAGYIILRLPYAVAPLFERWLEQHYPDSKDKVLNRIREMRGGRLCDSSFETRMTGSGPFAEQTARLFEIAARKAGIADHSPELLARHFRPPASDQMDLFENA